MYRFILSLCLLAATYLAGCTSHDAQDCVSDEECRTSRVCMQGECVERPPSEGLEVPEQYEEFFSNDAHTHVSYFTSFPGQASDAFHVYLFLRNNGRAHVFYEEGYLGHGFNRYREFDDDSPDTRTRIDTQWRPEDGQLMVGDVLACQPGMYGESRSLDCDLLRAVRSEEAVGGDVPLQHDDFESEIPDDATPQHEVLSAFQPE